jgi:hypothetical protein
VAHVDAGDVLGDGADELHVLEPGARVLGGDVVPAEVVDEARERQEDGGAIEVRVRRPDEDRLPAAVRQVGERGLVGHAARQAQGVDQRVLVLGVWQEAAAAERRPQAGVVDGDDRAQPAGRVARQVDLAVVVTGHVPEHVHRSISSARRS